MQCCGFDLQVVEEIGRTLHRKALMMEPQHIEAAQLGAIAGTAGPAMMPRGMAISVSIVFCLSRCHGWLGALNALTIW